MSQTTHQVRSDLTGHLEAIAEAIRADIKLARDDRERHAFLRGELYGIKQAIDIVRGYHAM